MTTWLEELLQLCYWNTLMSPNNHVQKNCLTNNLLTAVFHHSAVKTVSLVDKCSISTSLQLFKCNSTVICKSKRTFHTNLLWTVPSSSEIQGPGLWPGPFELMTRRLHWRTWWKHWRRSPSQHQRCWQASWQSSECVVWSWHQTPRRSFQMPPSSI